MTPSPAELGRLVFGRSFDGAEAAFIVRRANGRLAAVNAAAAALAGRRADELTGARAYDLVGDEVDVLEPTEAAMATLRRADGGAVPVALTVIAIDHARAGALAACRARLLTDDERRVGDLRRRAAELDGELAERAQRAAAAGAIDVRERALREVSEAVVHAAHGARLRALAGEVVARLAGPAGALESCARAIAAQLAAWPDGDAAAAALRGASARMARGAARLEGGVSALVRGSRRDDDLVPEWIDLAREVELACGLACACGQGARAAAPPRGAFAFVPVDAFHFVLAAAIAAAGRDVEVALTRRERQWIVAARGGGAGAEPDLAAAAGLADRWGGELASNVDGDATMIEVSVPAMIAP